MYELSYKCCKLWFSFQPSILTSNRTCSPAAFPGGLSTSTFPKALDTSDRVDAFAALADCWCDSHLFTNAFLGFVLFKVIFLRILWDSQPFQSPPFSGRTLSWGSFAFCILESQIQGLLKHLDFASAVRLDNWCNALSFLNNAFCTKPSFLALNPLLSCFQCLAAMDRKHHEFCFW